jgi:nucleoside-diphosphate-sugar epimerase
VVILRAGAVYGPGEPSRRAIPTFLRQAEAGEPLRLVNGGGANFNFLYIADVVDCMLKAIGSGAPGIYNVASGECATLLDVAQAVVEMFDEREVMLQIEPAEPASFVGFPALSIDRARETWGFAPRSLAEGLRDYRSSLAIAACQQ